MEEVVAALVADVGLGEVDEAGVDVAETVSCALAELIAATADPAAEMNALRGLSVDVACPNT